MALFNIQTGLLKCVNEPMGRLFGYEPRELEGRHPIMLHADQENAERRIDEARDVLLKTGTLHLEREARHKDGHNISCDLHGSLMIREPAPYAIMVFRDVSQRNEAEQAQRMLTAKLTALFENMPAGVVFADRKTGALVHSNKRADEILGRPVDATVGFEAYARWYRLEREDGSEYPTGSLPIPIVARTGRHAHVDDIFVRRPDGGRIQMEVRAGPVTWSAGESFDAVIAVFPDITQRKENERALQREQARQEEIQAELHRHERMRSIATLAGGVAHDFNNILVSVLGNASLIQAEMQPDHQWYQPITAILNGAERGAAITRQLLDYARGAPESPQPASVSVLIRDCLPLCRSAVPKNVCIEFDPQCADDVVELHGTQMQQILLNLILNAAEAMPEGGTVSLTTTACTGPPDSPPAGQACVRLEVKDQGSGIDAANVDHIFEPFFSTKELGRGLGLASVYGLLSNHGSHISVKSAPGQGTQFTVYFPLKEGPTAAQ